MLAGTGSELLLVEWFIFNGLEAFSVIFPRHKDPDLWKWLFLTHGIVDTHSKVIETLSHRYPFFGLNDVDLSISAVEEQAVYLASKY